MCDSSPKDGFHYRRAKDKGLGREEARINILGGVCLYSTWWVSSVSIAQGG